MPPTLRLALTAYTTVLLAELGDKTQLATFGLATSAPHGRLAVFAGAALALVTTSAVAVLGADAVSRLISPDTLRRASGVAFVLLGAWTLFGPRGD